MEKSLWLWGSTNPGQTTLPVASITRSAVAAAPSRPTSAILPPSIATSPRYGGLPAPSALHPPRIRTSSKLLLRRRRVADVRAEPGSEDGPQPGAAGGEAQQHGQDRGGREERPPRRDGEV